MPTLTALTLYPIKSCAGIALQEATLTPAGLMHAGIHDREWMVVDADGVSLTQRSHPKMALITPHITADTLELHAPGMPTLELPLELPDPDDAPTLAVRVWYDTVTVPAYDCDAATAAWFSEVLDVPCRLVRFHAQAQRITNSSWTKGADVPTRFSDGYPMLLISEASLADLNEKLRAQARPALPMNRFRPNLVIGGVGAFEEDYADTITIGNATLQPVKPCPRCIMPSVDQSTGIAGADPLDILQTYRANPKVDGAITFGMNVILQDGAGQIVHVGQEIDVQLAF